MIFRFAFFVTIVYSVIQLHWRRTLQQ